MKTRNKVLKTTAAIMIAVSAAFAQSVADLANAINNYGDDGGLTAAISGNTITVTGSETSIASLELNIPENVKVLWKAEIAGNTNRYNNGYIMDSPSLIELSGSGVFEMENGTINQTGSGNAISNASLSSVTINVFGGTVTNASTGYYSSAIRIQSAGVVNVSQIDENFPTSIKAIYLADEAELNITGGKVENTSDYVIYNYSTGTVNILGGTVNATQGTAIYNERAGTIDISGGTVDGGYGAINNYKNGIVNISGDAVVKATTGWAINNNESGTINISGGDVSATTGTAIRNYGAYGGKCKTNIYGGTVSTTTGTAIENGHEGVELTITGGMVKSESGYAITASDVGNIISISQENSNIPTLITSAGNSTILLGGSQLTITGGTIQNTAAGNVIYYNNFSTTVEPGAIDISGGLVRAGSGLAIYRNRYSYVGELPELTITGTVFAYGSSLADVIDHTNFTEPGHGGVVIAYNEELGFEKYIEGMDLHLFSLPAKTAAWGLQGDISGIAYKSDGFIEMSNIAVVGDNSEEAAEVFLAIYAEILGKDIADIEIADKATVQEALDFYNNILGETPKSLLTSEKELLGEFEIKIAELEAVETFKTAHAAILGKTTVNIAAADKTAVEAALDAYEALSEGAKSILLTSGEKDLLDRLEARISILGCEEEGLIDSKCVSESTFAEGIIWQNEDCRDELGRSLPINIGGTASLWHTAIIGNASVTPADPGFHHKLCDAGGDITYTVGGSEESRSAEIILDLNNISDKIGFCLDYSLIYPSSAAWNAELKMIIASTDGDHVATLPEASAITSKCFSFDNDFENLNLENVQSLKFIFRSLQSWSGWYTYAYFTIKKIEWMSETSEAEAFKTAHATILGKTAETITILDDNAVRATLNAYNALSNSIKALLTSEKELLDELLAKIELMRSELFEGDGTIDSPYIITAAEQLENLALLVNNGVTDFNNSNVYYELGSDIDLDAYSNWTPIGNFYYSPSGSLTRGFNANFDGRGYKIRNLKITSMRTLTENQISYEGNRSGLFGILSGKVENLGLEDVRIILHNSAVGGIAGSVWSGSITNCYVTGIVSTGTNPPHYSPFYEYQYGGIAGSLDNGSIDKSYSTAEVSINYNAASSSYAGGIAGVSEEGSITNSMALNPKVVGSTATTENNGTARVAYLRNGTLANNIAFAGMQNKENGTEWADTGSDKMDGESRTFEELQVVGGFLAFFASSPWKYETGKLPGLNNQAVEMPKHLKISNAEIPIINAQPASQLVDAGDILILTIDAAVSDGGTLSYQWYSNVVESNIGGAIIADATSESYEVPTNAEGIYYYYVEITNTNNDVDGIQIVTIPSDVAIIGIGEQDSTEDNNAIADALEIVAEIDYLDIQAAEVNTLAEAKAVVENIIGELGLNVVWKIIDDEFQAAINGTENAPEGAYGFYKFKIELRKNFGTPQATDEFGFAIIATAYDYQPNANAFKIAHAEILGKTVASIAIADKTAVQKALEAYEALSNGTKALLANEEIEALLKNLLEKINALEAEASSSSNDGGSSSSSDDGDSSSSSDDGSSSSSSDTPSPIISNRIFLDNVPSGTKVEVYNLRGERIYTGYSGNSEKSWPILIQAKGMYIVRIGNQTQRMVVK